MRAARRGGGRRPTPSPITRVVETSGSSLAWVSLKPVDRPPARHQLRAHMAHVGHPIVGDPKYFQIENWELPGGMQKPPCHLQRAHRHRCAASGAAGVIDADRAVAAAHAAVVESAPGSDATRYDPIRRTLRRSSGSS